MNRLLFSTMLIASAGLWSCEGKEGNPESTPTDQENLNTGKPVEHINSDSAGGNTPGTDTLPVKHNTK